MASAKEASESLRQRKLMVTLQRAEEVEGVIIYQGNQGALSPKQNFSGHQRAKHIDVAHPDYKSVARGKIKVQYCPTEDMLVDCFATAMAGPKCEELCKGHWASGCW
jgi:hypothetical protein